jgi:hypothetical protein
MNADAMRKEIGSIADNVAMLFSGVDGFLYDLRHFSTIRAVTGAGAGVIFVGEP